LSPLKVLLALVRYGDMRIAGSRTTFPGLATLWAGHMLPMYGWWLRCAVGRRRSLGVARVLVAHDHDGFATYPNWRVMAV